MITISDTIFDLCGNDFLEPYLRRQWQTGEDDEPQTPIAAIRILTDESEGANDTAVDTLCQERALPIAVLRCPYIVGTGMKGLPMRIAAGINRGTFVHIGGNEARISVVHATHVARAAAIAKGIQGSYSLTDGTDPTIHDLAEAIAVRLNDKRIITIKPKWARIWYGKTYFTLLSTDHTAPCTFTAVAPDFSPTPVTEYLKTHVYDEQSL